MSPPFQRRSLKRRQELTGGEEGKVASEMAEENKAGVGTSKKAKLSKEEGKAPVASWFSQFVFFN